MLQDGKTLPKEAHWTSVVLTTNGLPDEVMAVAASHDETLNYGAQTPFSDQLSFRWEGGLWEYDPQHDSIITAGNGGTKPIQAAFTIFYNQGTQRYDLEQTLQPDEQMWIDVGKLIQEHVPDKNGNTLPAELTAGSYEFRDLSNKGIGTLFESKIIYDKTYGHVAYGCGWCCGYTRAFFWFNPLGVPLSFTSDNGVNAHNACTGLNEDVSGDFYYKWTTANTSIATVNAFGTHGGVSLGSTTSQAWGDEQGNDRIQQCPIVTFFPSGGANVIPTVSVSCTPQHLSFGPTAPGDTTNGSCSTTSSPSGGAFSWTVSTNTVSLSSTTGSAISYTAANPSSSQGDTTITVTYTVNNQSSTAQSQPITVHKPTSLMVLSDTTNPTGQSCSVPCLANPGDGTCNATTSNCSYNSYLRTRAYSTVDQFGNRFVNVGILTALAQESLVTTANTCANLTFAPPVIPSTPDFQDQFWLCHTCCLPGGPGCNCSRSQTITVNGIVARQPTINYTCSSVTVTP